jgi:hypothetical protein
MSNTIDIGTQGAKRARLSSGPTNNLDALMLKIVTKHGADDREYAITQFKMAVNKHKAREELLATCLDYFATHALNRVVKETEVMRREVVQELRQARGGASRKVVKAGETAQASLVAKVEQKAKLLLLEMAMPNGKELRDCTGGDLRDMKLGRMFLALEKNLGADQRVGDIYKSNAALAKLRAD